MFKSICLSSLNCGAGALCLNDTIKGGLSVMKNELIMHNCVTFRSNPLPIITLDTAN